MTLLFVEVQHKVQRLLQRQSEMSKLSFDNEKVVLDFENSLENKYSVLKTL